MTYDKKIVLAQAQKHDSFYLYDQKGIESAAKLLQKHFVGVEFLYSIKANPNRHILKSIFDCGVGADAASLREVLMSREQGVLPEKIHFSAPGKSENDIKTAMDCATIVADSIGEIERINKIATEKGIIAQIGVRINPDFTFFGQWGDPSKFGIDQQLLYRRIDFIKSLKNVQVIGIHVHVRSQELRQAVLERYYENMLNLAVEVQDKLGCVLQFVNLGSGIGIPYEKNDLPLDIPMLGKAMSGLVEAFRTKLPDTAFFIETGRFLVGPNGVYVTKVMDKKQSYDKNFVILQNTLNGFARPSLSMMVRAYTEDVHPNSYEPLFTSATPFEIIPLVQEKDLEEVTIVGNLCTAADVIAKDVMLPIMNTGDVVLITNAGSYAAVLSPMQFASLPAPVEIFITSDGQAICD